MAFAQDTEVTPVLFRIYRERSEPEGMAALTAVFPTEPGDTQGRYMSCYARIGQHGSCSFDWYRQTRPATPDEYAELKAELESAPYGYRLKVCRRITPQHRKAFNAARRALSHKCSHP